MLGNHWDNFKEFWAPQNDKKQPKLAKIVWNDISKFIFWLLTGEGLLKHILSIFQYLMRWGTLYTAQMGPKWLILGHFLQLHQKLQLKTMKNDPKR